jgi:hypothetical protein
MLPMQSVFPFASFLPIIVIWSLFWKGFALWFAAKREEKIWFVIFLILNTAGIVELVYLVFVAKVFSEKKKQTKKNETKKKK